MMKNGFCINGGILHKVAKENGKLKSLFSAVEKLKGITYPTAHGLTNAAVDDIPNTSIEKIYIYLVEVLGYTPDELSRLSFTDVFSIVKDGEIFGYDEDNINRVVQLAQAQRTVKELSEASA